MTDLADLEFGVMLSATSNDYGLSEAEIPEVARRLATTAEDADFDVVVAGDHVAYPEAIPTDYEYSKTGKPPFDTTTPIYDVFQLFAHLGAVTDDIHLGTNVCAVPLRHPLVLAKNVLTAQSLTDGRFELGVAPGWLQPEFEALDVPFEERGSRTDEFLELFQLACEEGVTGFDGRHHSFDPVGFYPNPDEPVPIWVGGKSGATFRRVAEFGDGWSTLWDKPDEVRSIRERIMNAWTDFDREDDPEIGVLRPMNVDPEADGDRLFVGEAESIIEDIEAYADAGATRIIVDFYTTDVDEQAEQLERIGDRIVDAIR